MQKAQGCSKRYNLFIKKVKNKLKKKKNRKWCIVDQVPSVHLLALRIKNQMNPTQK